MRDPLALLQLHNRVPAGFAAGGVDGATRCHSATLKSATRPSNSRSRPAPSAPPSIDIGKLYGQTGHVHLRSRLHLDGEHGIEDHLHRRRRGRAALSRLPDRPTRRARRLPRDLLSPALRRIADRRAEGRFRLSRHPPHDGARADVAVLPGLPPRRASDVGDGRLRRRARRLLSRLHRHQRSHAARDRLDPHGRQTADAGGDGLQIFDRPAVRLSQERARLRRAISCACALRCRARNTRSIRCWRARSTASSSCTPTTSRTPRPRRCGSPARRRQSVRLHRRRHRLPVGPRARRRQRSGAEDARRDRLGRQHSRNISPRPRTRTTRSA